MKGTDHESHPKVALVVTASASIAFFRGQLAHYSVNGLRIETVSAPGPELDETRAQGSTPHSVPMEREICIHKDFVSLCRLWRLFRTMRPDLVVSGTPKAGLLGTLAARGAGVPHVAYTLLGLRLETASGWKRRLLWLTEWLACHAADAVLSISPSLRTRVIELGLASPDRCRMLGNGTINGVDMKHWQRTTEAENIGQQTREALGIPPAAPVIGFVGRLVRDKGISELYSAFIALRQDHSELRLLLVGDFEEGDPIPPTLRAQLREDGAVIITSFVDDPAQYYWAMDVLALPTYREGFPGVPLEAQAASVPVVCTDATGAIDAIVDGVTGIRVPVGDVDALRTALDRLLGNATLRVRMGREGCKWVAENFERKMVWRGLLAEYRSILQAPPHRSPRWIQGLLKRGMDRLLATLGLILSAPVWLTAAIAIRVLMGGPVLFRQVRPGYRGRPFTLFKLRTMRDSRDPNGKLLPDASRLTWLGRLMRALSLDELPQLWNVLRGDMSLVGPRPLLVEYLDRYSPQQARRHEVLPGITGWAQINGRNELTWEEKLKLDVWYVDHWSLWLDLRILGLTLVHVLRREGISQKGHATMPEFTGSPVPPTRIDS